MNTKNMLIGAAIGSALVGAGFLAFHPHGKNLCKRMTDLGIDLAENVLKVLRSNRTTSDSETAATATDTKSA